MQEMHSPVDGLTVRWISLPGGEQREVFSLDGVEYVKGEPADLAISVKYGLPLLLRRRDAVKAANALCSVHKGYRAMRKPRKSCEQCWRAYEARVR